MSKESEDEAGGPTATPTTTPKLGRRGRGGSFSSPGMKSFIYLTAYSIFGISVASTCNKAEYFLFIKHILTLFLTEVGKLALIV
jgi:hypothetical protein